MLAKYLPWLGFEPLQPDDLQAVYMPVWFIDGEITGTITRSGIKVCGVWTVWLGSSFHVLLGLGGSSIIEFVRKLFFV